MWFGKILIILLGIAFVCINILASLQSFVTVLNRHHYPPPGILYDIGGSQKMHLHCNGTGEPTVLYLHGWAGQSYDWAWIRPKVSRVARSCSLDRAGYAWSDAPACLRCPRTAQVHADNLNWLLKAANITGSLMLVVHADAVLDARVFVNTYTDFKVCSVVCVDCVDSATLPAGAQDNPAPLFWDVWRNLLPSGLGGIFAATNSIAQFRMYEELPEEIHADYVQNELKQKFPDTVVREYQNLPQSVQQAIQAGTFGSRPFVGLAAGLGLNASGVATLSTNSSMVYVEDSPHDMAFHYVFSTIILDQITRFISLARITGCAAGVVVNTTSL